MYKVTDIGSLLQRLMQTKCKPIAQLLSLPKHLLLSKQAIAVMNYQKLHCI
jgi:hypothetical protein